MKQAFILAAGLGTRLKPLTDTMPKALVPVCDKPLLQHQIERLRAVGFTRLVVNVHHFADQIVQFLDANQNFGLDIRVSDERTQLLETGGAIRHARPLFDTSLPVLVHNVDILHNLDLADFYCQQQGEATLLVSPRTTSRYLAFDTDGQLCGWTNTKTGEIKGLTTDRLLAFSGIHLLRPSLLPTMDEWPERFSVIDFYLSVCHTHSIRAHEAHNLRMVDVGKLDTLQQAEDFLKPQT